MFYDKGVFHFNFEQKKTDLASLQTNYQTMEMGIQAKIIGIGLIQHPKIPG